jgi:hypothetical protein
VSGISGFSSNAWPWYRNDFLGGGGFVASNWPSLPGRVNVDDQDHPTVKNTILTTMIDNSLGWLLGATR